MAATWAGPSAIIPALATDLGLGQILDARDASVGSGRYSPGPGMVCLLVEIYQVKRTPLRICSLIRPGNPAKDSFFLG